MKIGTKVKCLCGSIDRGRGRGEIGVVTSLTRFSQYHPQEASVTLDRGEEIGFSGGWFWVSDLEELEGVKS